MYLLRPIQRASTHFGMTLLLLCSLSVTSLTLHANAGHSGAGRTPSLQQVVKKCAQIGLILSCCGVKPTDAGHWVSGTTLGCSDLGAVSDQGATSVNCLQYGDLNHGVTCEDFSYAWAGPYTGVICSQVYSPDERLYRHCSQTGYDTIGADAGVVCDSFGEDLDAPYCTATAIAHAQGYENVVCSQVYCPSCQHYVSDSGSCFPEKTWLKVKNSDGSIQVKAMREIRIGDLVQVAQDLTQGHPETEVYSKIVDVPHRQPGKKGGFLKVVHNGTSFLISPEHLVYVAHEADEAFVQKTAQVKFARELSPGDLLWTDDAKTVAIDSAPETVAERGMYAPESEAGTLVVYGTPEATQGTTVSCYSSFKDPASTQAFFRLRRSVFPPEQIEENTVRRAGPWDETLLDAAKAVYPSGFGVNPQSAGVESATTRPQPRKLRGNSGV